MERWVFVQARLGSKRLQEKVLKKLGNKHVIEHLHERLLFLKSLFENLEIAYLIPDNYQHKQLEKFIQTFPNTHLFLGNEDNVLGRFINASKVFKPGKILRITADCPYVDPYALEHLIRLSDEQDVDYSFLGLNFAEGICGDYFTLSLLQRAAENKRKKAEDIEHITPFFHRNKTQIKFLDVENEIDDSDFRIVLDSKDDFCALKKLEEWLNKEKVPEKYKFSTIRKILQNHPEIASINENEIRNEDFDVFSLD